MTKKEMITVVIVEPNQPARVEKIENTLEAKQAIVGGLIDCIGFDGYDIIFNDEGKFLDLEPNFGIFGGQDYIAGTAIFAGINYDTGEFTSLDKAHIVAITSQFRERGL
jgi:Domain of unknown function (DUF3846)